MAQGSWDKDVLNRRAQGRSFIEYAWWRGVRASQRLYEGPEGAEISDPELVSRPPVISALEARGALRERFERTLWSSLPGDTVAEKLDGLDAGLNAEAVRRVVEAVRRTVLDRSGVDVISDEVAGPPERWFRDFHMTFQQGVWVAMSPFDPAFGWSEANCLLGTRLGAVAMPGWCDVPGWEGFSDAPFDDGGVPSASYLAQAPAFGAWEDGAHEFSPNLEPMRMAGGSALELKRLSGADGRFLREERDEERRWLSPLDLSGLSLLIPKVPVEELDDRRAASSAIACLTAALAGFGDSIADLDDPVRMEWRRRHAELAVSILDVLDAEGIDYSLHANVEGPGTISAEVGELGVRRLRLIDDASPHYIGHLFRSDGVCGYNSSSSRGTGRTFAPVVPGLPVGMDESDPRALATWSRALAFSDATAVLYTLALGESRPLLEDATGEIVEVSGLSGDRLARVFALSLDSSGNVTRRVPVLDIDTHVQRVPLSAFSWANAFEVVTAAVSDFSRDSEVWDDPLRARSSGPVRLGSFVPVSVASPSYRLWECSVSPDGLVSVAAGVVKEGRSSVAVPEAGLSGDFIESKTVGASDEPWIFDEIPQKWGRGVSIEPHPKVAVGESGSVAGLRVAYAKDPGALGSWRCVAAYVSPSLDVWKPPTDEVSAWRLLRQDVEEARSALWRALDPLGFVNGLEEAIGQDDISDASTHEAILDRAREAGLFSGEFGEKRLEWARWLLGEGDVLTRSPGSLLHPDVDVEGLLARVADANRLGLSPGDFADLLVEDARALEEADTFGPDDLTRWDFAESWDSPYAEELDIAVANLGMRCGLWDSDEERELGNIAFGAALSEDFSSWDPGGGYADDGAGGVVWSNVASPYVVSEDGSLTWSPERLQAVFLSAADAVDATVGVFLSDSDVRTLGLAEEEPQALSADYAFAAAPLRRVGPSPDREDWVEVRAASFNPAAVEAWMSSRGVSSHTREVMEGLLRSAGTTLSGTPATLVPFSAFLGLSDDPASRIGASAKNGALSRLVDAALPFDESRSINIGVSDDVVSTLGEGGEGVSEFLSVVADEVSWALQSSGVYPTPSLSMRSDDSYGLWSAYDLSLDAKGTLRWKGYMMRGWSPYVKGDGRNGKNHRTAPDAQSVGRVEERFARDLAADTGSSDRRSLVEVSGVVGPIWPQGTLEIGEGGVVRAKDGLRVESSWGCSPDFSFVPQGAGYFRRDGASAGWGAQGRARGRSYALAVGRSAARQVLRDLTFGCAAEMADGRILGSPMSLASVVRNLAPEDSRLAFGEEPAHGVASEVVDETWASRVKFPRAITEAGMDAQLTLSLGKRRAGVDNVGRRLFSDLGEAELAVTDAPAPGRPVAFDPSNVSVGTETQLTARVLSHGASIDPYSDEFAVDSEGAGPSAMLSWEPFGVSGASVEEVCAEHDAPDRLAITLSNLRHCLAVSEPTGFCMALSGGWCKDDAIVVSADFASKNAVPGLPGRRPRPLQSGDKICDFHGNKGVISRVVEPKADGDPLERFFFANRDHLGVMMNSTSTPKRRNVGNVGESSLHELADLMVPRQDGSWERVGGAIAKGTFVVSDKTGEFKDRLHPMRAEDKLRSGGIEGSSWDDLRPAKGCRVSIDAAMVLASQEAWGAMEMIWGDRAFELLPAVSSLEVLGLTVREDGTLGETDLSEVAGRPGASIYYLSDAAVKGALRKKSRIGVDLNAATRDLRKQIAGGSGVLVMSFDCGEGSVPLPDGEHWAVPLEMAERRRSLHTEENLIISDDHTRAYERLIRAEALWRASFHPDWVCNVPLSGSLFSKNPKNQKPRIGPPTPQEIKRVRDEAVSRGRQALSTLRSQVLAQTLSSKHKRANCFKGDFGTVEVEGSATLVLETDPTLSIAKVGMSAASMKALGLKEGDVALVGRYPMNSAGGIRAFEVTDDGRGHGLRMQPALFSSFDADCDGDTMMVVGVGDPEAEGKRGEWARDCLAKLSAAANLVDPTDEPDKRTGLRPLWLADGDEIEAISSLSERREREASGNPSLEGTLRRRWTELAGRAQQALCQPQERFGGLPGRPEAGISPMTRQALVRCADSCISQTFLGRSLVEGVEPVAPGDGALRFEGLSDGDASPYVRSLFDVAGNLAKKGKADDLCSCLDHADIHLGAGRGLNDAGEVARALEALSQGHLEDVSAWWEGLGYERDAEHARALEVDRRASLDANEVKRAATGKAGYYKHVGFELFCHADSRALWTMAKLTYKPVQDLLQAKNHHEVAREAVERLDSWQVFWSGRKCELAFEGNDPKKPRLVECGQRLSGDAAFAFAQTTFEEGKEPGVRPVIRERMELSSWVDVAKRWCDAVDISVSEEELRHMATSGGGFTHRMERDYYAGYRDPSRPPVYEAGKTYVAGYDADVAEDAPLFRSPFIQAAYKPGEPGVKLQRLKDASERGISLYGNGALDRGLCFSEKNVLQTPEDATHRRHEDQLASVVDVVEPTYAEAVPVVDVVELTYAEAVPMVFSGSVPTSSGSFKVARPIDRSQPVLGGSSAARRRVPVQPTIEEDDSCPF